MTVYFFQAALLFAAFALWDKFHLARYDNGYPWDEDLYLTQVDAGGSLREQLSSNRTLGYLLFLKCVRKLSPSLALLPLCQVGLHVLAVLLFYGGLRRIRVAGWMAAAAASTLLYSNTILTFGSHVMSDAPALSLAVATIGMLLMVVGRPRDALAWSGLALSLFLTYQTRPAYLFLLPLLPPLGLLLLGLVSPRGEWVRWRWRVGIGLAAVCALPFLAFCTLRWAMMGHLGLVSFGGANLVGIAGQFLSDDLVCDHQGPAVALR